MRRTLTDAQAISILEGDRILYDGEWLTITDTTTGASAGGVPYVHVLAQTDDGLLRANTLITRFTPRANVRFARRRSLAA